MDVPGRSFFSEENFDEWTVKDKSWDFEDNGEDGSSLVLIPDYVQSNNGQLRPKLKVLRTPYRMLVGIWEFFFYYRRFDDDTVRDHAKKAKIANIKSRIDALIHDIKTKLSDEDKALFQITDLFNEANVSKLKEIYEDVVGKNRLNVTSLATFHGPIIDVREHNYHHYCYRTVRKNFGTLLTGDIEINKKVSFQNFIAIFVHIGKISVFFKCHTTEPVQTGR